jgi:hypothetical protein
MMPVATVIFGYALMALGLWFAAKGEQWPASAAILGGIVLATAGLGALNFGSVARYVELLLR